MRAARLAATAVAIVCALAPAAGGRAQPAPGAAPPGRLAGAAESFAYRVEYDLPLPAGVGTVAHVDASISRSTSGERAHGLAAAPTELGPVVGGKYEDPLGSGKPQRALPQAECDYPGALLGTHFVFPTDTQKETGALPATSYAIANCGAGPLADLHVRNGPVGDPVVGQSPGGITAEEVASDAVTRPDRGVLDSSSASRAERVSLLGGLVRIGAVVAIGSSSTAARPSTAHSSASVAVSDLAVGGVSLSLTSSERDGVATTTITSGAVSAPVESAAGAQALSAINAALHPTGCALTVLDQPDAYPQGFLFARPAPEIGVRGDGTLGASYRGGVLLVCNLHDNPVSTATGFSPERVQVLVGFVYTSAQATADVGGFSLGELLPSIAGGVPAAPAVAATPPVTPGAPELATGPAGSPLAPAVAAPTAARPRTVVAVADRGLSAGTRWLLAAACLAAWAALTHLGITRLVRA